MVCIDKWLESLLEKVKFRLSIHNFICQFDLIISNPPYIPDSMVPLDQEVRDYDPALALYGGEDGLDIVRDLVATTKLILREGGLLVFLRII